MKLFPFLVGGAIAGLTVAMPAHAYLTQTVGPLSFSHFGGTTPPTTTPLAFPPFSASAAANLTGVNIYLKNTAFSGTVNVANFTGGPLPLNVDAKPTFEFNVPTPMVSLTGTAASVAASPSTLAGGYFGTATLSGPYTGMFTAVTTNTASLQNYFATSPVINKYSVAYSFGPSGVGGGASTATNFAGQIFLEYQYVPGPLPLLGAGAAFGWSRRLRKRIATTA